MERLEYMERIKKMTKEQLENEVMYQNEQRRGNLVLALFYALITLVVTAALVIKCL